MKSGHFQVFEHLHYVNPGEASICDAPKVHLQAACGTPADPEEPATDAVQSAAKTVFALRDEVALLCQETL